MGHWCLEWTLREAEGGQGRAGRGRAEQEQEEEDEEEECLRGWLDSATPSSPPAPGAQLFSQRILRGWFITFEYSGDRRRSQNPPPAPSSK